MFDANHITVYRDVSATDFMHMPDGEFTLDVVARGILVRITHVVVDRSNSCVLTGSLAIIKAIDETSSPLVKDTHMGLLLGPNTIIDLDENGHCIVRFSGDQLPQSRTFCARDLSLRIIAAIEAATAPVAA